MDSASMPRSRGVDRVLLTVALAAHGLVWLFATRPVALDPDPMNLAYGMYRFDITHSNPHAPGYLIYVWTLKAVHRLTGGGAALLERFATVQLVALLFALAAIFTVYAADSYLRSFCVSPLVVGRDLLPRATGLAASALARALSSVRVGPSAVVRHLRRSGHRLDDRLSAFRVPGRGGPRERRRRDRVDRPDRLRFRRLGDMAHSDAS
ncbi:MAG: hypothetical protein JRF55_11945, partial [Deltaproteobacteria bacterium]|nr:hypothetical protein [Deltaproteobacteria bacterium]